MMGVAYGRILVLPRAIGCPTLTYGVDAEMLHFDFDLQRHRWVLAFHVHVGKVYTKATICVGLHRPDRAFASVC